MRYAFCVKNSIFTGMNTEFNPFLVSGYKDANHFCDRRKETEALMRNAQGQVNSTLLAMRRIGKTGLIHHVLNKLSRRNFICIYVDIYATGNFREFTNALATAIYREVPQRKGIGDRIFSMIKQLRPVIAIDPLNGAPELSLNLARSEQYPQTVRQLLNALDAQKKHVLIAIDEFQQITNYPEKNTEAVLRTHIQQLRNVSFVFCGSNQKLMHEIFNSYKRPFYASCSNLSLEKIDEKEYISFIRSIFKRYKRTITDEAVDFILLWTHGHTFYTQFLCNRVFSTGQKRIDANLVYSVCDQILVEQETVFYQYRNILTAPQWGLLKAIASEERVSAPSSSSFIRKYQLGAASTISRSLDALVAGEFILRHTEQSERYYMLIDKFLMRWLQRKSKVL